MNIEDIKLYDVVAHKDAPHDPLWVVEINEETNNIHHFDDEGLRDFDCNDQIIPYTPKPEPREVWVAINAAGVAIEVDAQEPSDGRFDNGFKAIKFREVLDDS